MEIQIQGLIYGYEHGMTPAWTINKVVELLNKFHMKRTARCLSLMDSHAAIGKIYELAGVDMFLRLTTFEPTLPSETWVVR